MNLTDQQADTIAEQLAANTPHHHIARSLSIPLPTLARLAQSEPVATRLDALLELQTLKDCLDLRAHQREALTTLATRTPNMVGQQIRAAAQALLRTTFRPINPRPAPRAKPRVPATPAPLPPPPDRARPASVSTSPKPADAPTPAPATHRVTSTTYAPPPPTPPTTFTPFALRSGPPIIPTGAPAILPP